MLKGAPYPALQSAAGGRADYSDLRQARVMPSRVARHAIRRFARVVVAFGRGSSAWPDPRPGATHQLVGVLAGGSGDVSSDDISGVPVQAGAGTVVAHGGPRVGMRGGFLYIAERHVGV